MRRKIVLNKPMNSWMQGYDSPTFILLHDYTETTQILQFYIDILQISYKWNMNREARDGIRTEAVSLPLPGSPTSSQ